MAVSINGTTGLNGPCFSVASTTTTSCTNNTDTKLMYDVENLDSGGCFNPTGSTVNGIPAYSFMPNVPGWYQINIAMQYTGTTYAGIFSNRLYKNNTLFQEYDACAGTQWFHAKGSHVIYFNGTTDYIDARGFQVQGATQPVRGTMFSGFLVRAV